MANTSLQVWLGKQQTETERREREGKEKGKKVSLCLSRPGSDRAELAQC